MMKVIITHLKAPWPEGAALGDIVELDAPLMPAWAVGKCVEAPADAEVFVPAQAEEEAAPAPRKGGKAKAED